MSDSVPTIRIKPSHESQGDFVEINETDFDPAVHVKLGDPEAPKAATKRKARK